MRNLACCILLVAACGGGGSKPQDASTTVRDSSTPADLTNPNPQFAKCVEFCQQGITCGVQDQTDCSSLCDMIVGPDGAESCYNCDFDCANSSSCTAFVNCYSFCPPC